LKGAAGALRAETIPPVNSGNPDSRSAGIATAHTPIEFIRGKSLNKLRAAPSSVIRLGDFIILA